MVAVYCVQNLRDCGQNDCCLLDGYDNEGETTITM